MTRTAATRKPVVAVLNKIHDAGLEYLRERSDLRYVDSDREPRASVDAALAEADAIIVRAFKVTPAVLDSAPHLFVLSKHGVGFETVDLNAATERAIPVTNTGAANSTAVAEYAVALMLATIRRIPQMHELVRNGGFKQRLSLVFGDLWERKVGLIGFGNIGRLVARITRNGFNARVVAYDPLVSADVMKSADVKRADNLEQLLAEADVISIHTPLNAKTRGMIGAKELRTMKPSAIVINTSRGGIIDQVALADALKEGVIYGAGIDVFDPEPPPENHPLFADIPNLVLSPHLGGATELSRRHTALQSAEAIFEVLDGNRPTLLLNPEIWEGRRRFNQVR